MRAFLAFLLACGSRTGLVGENEPIPDDPQCEGGTTSLCGPLKFSVGIAESCQIAAEPCGLDAEGFVGFTCPFSKPNCDGGAPAKEKRRIFALNRMGAGHVAAFCDSTSTQMFLDNAPIVSYLGQIPSPRVASLAKGYPCGSIRGVLWLGEDLPAKYTTAKSLAQDWDVLIVCSNFGGKQVVFKPEWTDRLTAFVRDEGKGLLVVADYLAAGSAPTLYDPVNAITKTAGIVFEVSDLGYSALKVDLACVPDMPKK